MDHSEYFVEYHMYRWKCIVDEWSDNNLEIMCKIIVLKLSNLWEIIIFFPTNYFLCDYYFKYKRD